MVGQDASQLCLVFRLQKVFHRTRREFRECFICGSEDRKRTGTFQGVNQACGLNCRNKGFEGSGGNRSIHNILSRGCISDRTKYESRDHRARSKEILHLLLFLTQTVEGVDLLLSTSISQDGKMS